MPTDPVRLGCSLKGLGYLAMSSLNPVQPGNITSLFSWLAVYGDLAWSCNLGVEVCLGFRVEGLEGQGTE